MKTDMIERIKNANTIQTMATLPWSEWVPALDGNAMKSAKKRQDSLAKPPESLGQLEDISIKLAGITGNVNAEVEKTAVAIFSADNGVVEEGISSAPQSVTISQTMNFTRKVTGVGALARTFDSDLLVTDIGINADVPEALLTEDGAGILEGKIWNKKISYGTANLVKGPAMSDEQLAKAFETGFEVAKIAAEAGYDIVGIGEMGIGNTTTSTAVLTALTGMDSINITGRGGGLTDDAFGKKQRLIHDILDRFHKDNPLPKNLGTKKPTKEDLNYIFTVLRNIGGYDIAAMTACFIGLAAFRKPIVIDGYISVVAALAASLIVPMTKEYMIASHLSEEPGYDAAIHAIGLKPMLNLGMRLGEGSGCVLAFQVIKGACGIMNHMATFSEAEINDDYLEEIRKQQ